MNESLYIYQLFMNYNLSILLFNLLPIIPLDGAKVLNILLNKFISFRKSHKITMYISVLSIIILIVCFYSDLNMIMISIILICFLYKECKNRIYLYNMFLAPAPQPHYKYSTIKIPGLYHTTLNK